MDPVLVLSRKPEQKLLLGDDIVLTVLAIDGDRVKIGIEAPRKVTILRYEVYEQIHASNDAASASRPSPRAVADALRGRVQGPPGRIGVSRA